ncbi:hypothetical protein CYLTODRAFT_427217 [Cylindrobasidium torrendii FP15055 ss-10]|uniref:Uncharacterized protein n=1 Tax=Cylindrobasidium torrendii FP15055 ss-10 TaxID=1314674 RepID=A0A0D7AVK3_9AGAR|nr:hypothetical protein CYLTODRAFT_427217 [Cylindrobasidium torrendii FP15055 ss-10]
MGAVYTEDCVSLNGIFGEAIEHAIYSDSSCYYLRRHEPAVGMQPGELSTYMDHPANRLKLQPDVAPHFSSLKICLVPEDAAIRQLCQVYSKNQGRFPANRVVLKPTVSDGAKCVLKPNAEFTTSIYLRHPVTGLVTLHRHPYPAFPTINVRSADTALLTLHAHEVMTSASKWPMLEPQLLAFSKIASKFIPTPYIPIFPFSGTAPTRPLLSALASSRKRQGTSDTVSSRPSKRPRRAAPRKTAPARPSPAGPATMPAWLPLSPLPLPEQQVIVMGEIQNTLAQTPTRPKRSRAPKPCPPPRTLPPRAAKAKAKETMAPPKSRARKGNRR